MGFDPMNAVGAAGAGAISSCLVASLPVVAGVNAGVGALSSLALGSALGAGGGALLGMGLGGAGVVAFIPTSLIIGIPAFHLFKAFGISEKTAKIMSGIISSVASFFAAAAITWAVAAAIGCGMPFTAILLFSAVSYGIALGVGMSLALLCSPCCCCAIASVGQAPDGHAGHFAGF